MHGKFVHPKYRPEIDGLRAVAVLAVIGFHAFPEWVRSGFLGVDVFFVISGFLISTIIFENLTKNTFSFRSFYSRRVKRIFPALILMLTCCWAFGWFALFADEFRLLERHIWGGAAFISNFTLWAESGYFDRSATTKPLLHLWSLGIEEQFYLTWPLILFLSWRLKLNMSRVLIVITLVSMTAYFGFPHATNAVVHLWRGTQLDMSRVFYSPLARFWELSLGGILAYRKLNSPTRAGIEPRRTSLNEVCAALGLVLVASSMVLLDRPNETMGWAAFLPVLGTCLILTAGTDAWINRTILAHPAFVWIGLISYPLYLWHWPILSFLQIIENGLVPSSIRIAAVLLSIGLAWCTYRLVETPIRFEKQSSHKGLILVAMMSLIGAMGLRADIIGSIENRPRITASLAKALPLPSPPPAPVILPSQAPENCNRHPDIPHCTLLSRDASPTVALIGDSHASQLFAGLEPYYQQRHENLLAMESCMILKGVDYVQNGAYQPLCPQYRDAILDYVLRTTSIKTVILSFRGPISVMGVGYWPSGAWTDMEPRTRQLGMPEQPNLKDNPQIFELGLRSTLSILSEHGKQIIFVFDNPELGFQPISCEERPLSLPGTQPRPACAIERRAYEKRSSSYVLLVQSVLQDFPMVKTFSSASVLCDEKYCHASKRGVLLYMDDDHLSYEGSMLVGRSFNPH